MVCSTPFCTLYLEPGTFCLVGVDLEPGTPNAQEKGLPGYFQQVQAIKYHEPGR
jgi:hypothetical protein